MRNPKFKAGDILVRKAYKDSKSSLLRDEIEIIKVISDGHPIVSQLWYICKDYKGKIVSGLISVVDASFEKV